MCQASYQGLHGTGVLIVVPLTILSGHHAERHCIYAIPHRGSASSDCYFPSTCMTLYGKKQKINAYQKQGHCGTYISTCQALLQSSKLSGQGGSIVKVSALVEQRVDLPYSFSKTAF